ncbi:MAG: biopolymer transport protein ExbB [Saprospiraceae bacterium]|jgi:biopolymer transport protein ExbB
MPEEQQMISMPGDSAKLNDVVEGITQTEETLPIFDLLLDSWVIILPLLVLSIIAVYIWVERYTAIQKASKLNPDFMSTIKDFVTDGKFDEAKALCSENDTPVSRMLEKGISRLGRPLKDISTSIETVGKLEVSVMEKNLSILATISGAAPMIGFLGTVIGMMSTFHEMAKGGSGGVQIESLSQGIMFAMTTTVVGLVVGIIAYLAYNTLVAKVDKVVHDMEDKSMEFMDLLHQPAS